MSLPFFLLREMNKTPAFVVTDSGLLPKTGGESNMPGSFVIRVRGQFVRTPLGVMI